MGIFSRFRKTQTAGEFPTTPDYYRAWDLTNQLYELVMGKSESELWRTQPYLRMVVNFLARNIAQLGLHVFLRESETDRLRVRDSSLARVLRKPNAATSSYELIYGLVADLALYDRAYWLIGRENETLVRLPPSWVKPVGGDALMPDHYRVRKDDVGNTVEVPLEEILPFHGWHPASLQLGESAVSALRTILAEQMQAAEYRRQVWERGGRVGSVLSRPKDAPQWSDAARSQFKQDWETKFTGSGSKSGGTPLLEDGMTLNRVDFSAHEQQYVEAQQLALETVAQVFHVNPTMIGSTANTSYSNVREFRKMLYGDTLGPLLAQIEARINTFLVPLFDDREEVYVEFNLEEKLQGNFEEQTTALQSAVGRPWMSADEARARFNLPAVGGNADDLVVPLNVLFGGQASPRDSGGQNRNFGPVQTKARGNETHEQKYEQALSSFFHRQSSEVVPLLTAKADWWDREKWDQELTAILHRLGLQVSQATAHEVLQQSGFDPDVYSVEQTEAFVLAVASRVAEQMNATTKDQLEHARTADDPDGAVRHVFDIARSSRSAESATTAVTLMSGFGATEAGRQIGTDNATKTWRTTSTNPRKEHARMNGETVGIDEKFSNGAMWPADRNLSPDQSAGCRCEVEVTFPREGQ